MRKYEMHAMAAVETLLDACPEFAHWWAREIGIEKRLAILSDIEAALIMEDEG